VGRRQDGGRYEVKPSLVIKLRYNINGKTICKFIALQEILVQVYNTPNLDLLSCVGST